MKYKHIFFVWLFAEVILDIGAFIAIITQSIFSSYKFDRDYGLILLVIGLSLLWSLPSLFAMWVFHYFYSKKYSFQKNYFKVYSILIVAINIVYALCSYFIFTIKGEFFIYFIFTTIAGLLALYFVYLRIKSNTKKFY